MTEEPVADTAELPFVDEHGGVIGAPRPRVWATLERQVASSLRRFDGHLLTRVLGTAPPAGFAVAERAEPDRLVLAGRHRLAR